MKAKFKKMDLAMNCWYCGKARIDGVIMFSNNSEVPSHAYCAKLHNPRIKNLRSLKIRTLSVGKSSQAKITEFHTGNEAQMPIVEGVGA